MPRKTKSATTLIVNFFMNGPLAEARQALETAQAIIRARDVAAAAEPVKVDKPKRPRRGRRRETEPHLPGTTAAAPDAAASGPTGVVPPATRRPRRGGGAARPPVTTATEAVSAPAGAPLPDQAVGD